MPASGQRAHELEELVDAAAARYHRLVLVVGPAGSGKTPLLRDLAATRGFPLVNVNRLLGERLLDLTRRQRALSAGRLLGELVDQTKADTVLLDNLELLFHPELEQDALRLLQGLSRNRSVVAAWPGEAVAGALSYARPGHPEHVRHPRPDAVILGLGTAGEPVPSTTSKNAET